MMLPVQVTSADRCHDHPWVLPSPHLGTRGQAQGCVATLERKGEASNSLAWLITAVVNEPWPSLLWHSQDWAVTKLWGETGTGCAYRNGHSGDSGIRDPWHGTHHSSKPDFLTQNNALAQVGAGKHVWWCRSRAESGTSCCRLRTLLILQIRLLRGGKAAPAPGAVSAQAG